MRRSLLVLAASAGNVAVTAGSGAKKGGDAELTAHVKPLRQAAVEIAESPANSFVPSASEAPELLQAYVEPKPFISPRRVQLFAVSTAVGATTVALIYFLISKSISANTEDEHGQVDAVAAKNRLAAEERQKLFPDFAAPSSYDQLKEKMEQRDREMARQEVQVYNATSMLNTEIVYHVKMWWNRCLTNVQDAVDRLSAAQERRRQNQVESNIEATLRYNGYKLIDLKRAV